MRNTSLKETYLDWRQFDATQIPSSVSTYPLLYEKIGMGQSIVDIGCGFGKTCFELLSKNYSPVVGFDINDDGIAFAAQQLKSFSEEISNSCRFEVRDALNTNYEDNSFQVGIMQAFMTTLSKPEHRQKALTEARRIISKDGGLYIADFVQTWYSEKMLLKYEKGERETGERGTFNAYDKETGAFQYQAHHYTEHELVYLLRDSGFRIDTFQYHIFTTRSGNRVNGAVIWAV